MGSEIVEVFSNSFSSKPVIKKTGNYEEEFYADNSKIEAIIETLGVKKMTHNNAQHGNHPQTV